MAEPAGNGALLRVNELHVRYQVMGPVKALMTGIGNRFVDAVIDVTFDVKPGTTFALVGESDGWADVVVSLSAPGQNVVSVMPNGSKNRFCRNSS